MPLHLPLECGIFAHTRCGSLFLPDNCGHSPAPSTPRKTEKLSKKSKSDSNVRFSLSLSYRCPIPVLISLSLLPPKSGSEGRNFRSFRWLQVFRRGQSSRPHELHLPQDSWAWQLWQGAPNPGQEEQEVVCHEGSEEGVHCGERRNPQHPVREAGLPGCESRQTPLLDQSALLLSDRGSFLFSNCLVSLDSPFL